MLYRASCLNRNCLHDSEAALSLLFGFMWLCQNMPHFIIIRRNSIIIRELGIFIMFSVQHRWEELILFTVKHKTHESNFNNDCNDKCG